MVVLRRLEVRCLNASRVTGPPSAQDARWIGLLSSWHPSPGLSFSLAEGLAMLCSNVVFLFRRSGSTDTYVCAYYKMYL